MTELAGALWLVAGLGMLAGTGILAASCLRPRSALELLLSTYVVGWLWLVTVMLVLSPPGLVTRRWLVAGLVLGLGLALLAWSVRGRPRPPSFRPALELPSLVMRRPAVAVLAVAVLAGFAYSVALALFTPVNDGDALAYHLARAAFWRQERQIGYVQGAVDLRLDVSPPNAEIGQLATILLSEGDRYVAVPQLLSYGALILGVATLARRIGLDRREAIFGALLFASLPVVVVQASAGLNDLVVASFLVVAVVFAHGRGRCSLVVFALALGLALGTKVIAVFALPLLALVLAVARPRREWLDAAVAFVAGIAAGAAWYGVNLVETGAVDGDLAGHFDQRVESSLAAIVVNVARYGLDFVDMSGAPAPTSYLFAVVALALLVLSFLFFRRSSATGMSLLRASFVTAGVLAVPLVAELGRRVVYRTWLLLGRPPTPEYGNAFRLNVLSDPTDSWYGALGLLLLVVGTVTVVVHWRRRTLMSPALVFSLAPWILLVTIASTVIWDPWRGRFLVFGIALAAATWGIFLRWRTTAASLAAIAVVSLALSLVTHLGKPSGLASRVGVPAEYILSAGSIWTLDRTRAQALLRRDAGEEEMFRFVARRVPADASIAIAPRENDFLYPYFGPKLDRTVFLVPPSRTVPEAADWLVLSPGARVRRCEESWRRALADAGGWSVDRRIAPDSCPPSTS